MNMHGLRNSFCLSLAFIGISLAAAGGVTVLTCDGTDDYVLVGTPAALQIPSNNPLTVEGWVYFRTVDTRDCLYSKNYGRSSPYTYMFGCIDSGDLSAYDGAVWRKPSPTVKVPTGGWHHLAYSFNGTTMTYYLDGAAVGSSVFSFVNTATHTIKIGGYLNTADINGMISDVRVWNHARSAAQIQAVMSRRLTGGEPGLLGYWRLDEGTGSTAFDQTASRSDGTLMGAASWASSGLNLALFTVAHPLTGSTRYTNTNQLDVVYFPLIKNYSHYQITEFGAAPDGAPGAWTSTNSLPETVSFTMPAMDTNVVLTVWHTNLNVSVELASSETEIIFTTVAPTAAAWSSLSRPIAVGFTTVELAGDDLDNGSVGGTVFAEPIGIYAFMLSCPQDVSPEDPYRVTLVETGTFAVAFTAVNEAGNQSTATTCTVSVTEGGTLTWIGQGANALASTAANWTPAVTPYHGCSVVFDDDHYGKAQSNVTWDANIVPIDWVQTGAFSNRVTVKTRYPAPGQTFTNLVIARNCTIQGGAVTHPANTGDTAETDRLSVSIGGDFVLGSGGKIDLFGCGYAASRGPGAGVSAQRAGKGASHGGVGATVATLLPSPTYGSVTRPARLGSGSTARGGGALWLVVTGEATINGEISAKGANEVANNRYGGGAGGSLYLDAATINGNGLLNARGGEGYYTGGGGRIALVARAGADTGQLRFEAFGGTPATSGRGSPGTVYCQTTAFRELIIDAGNLATQAGISTELPPALELAGYTVHPVVGGELEDVTLILTNSARAMLTSSLRMGDFAWITANSTLNLDGRLLYLKADEPAGAFPAAYGNGTINYNGGDIIWGDVSASMPLFLSSGPNGSASRDPEIPDNLYPFDSEVTLTAVADPGYDFIWWEGDVPEGGDRKANPLDIRMNQSRTLRALFASNAANTRTWTGDATVRWASNATNWYPAVTPASGNHIVFDATSRMECFWDLNIKPASWTQTAGYTASYDFFEGYFGWVTLHTRYPGQGAFTNLHITGNCTLAAGTWTHPANTGGDTAVDRISVTVDGDWTLGTNAVIDVKGRGYASSRGPGHGNIAQRTAGNPVMVAGSHGGRGGSGSAATPAPCYGSILEPEALGSGASGSGGGAARLDVGGHSLIAGLIDARGLALSSQTPGPAGGSILLRTGSLDGAGTLDASGAAGYQAGGGGRIAVYLTESNDFGHVQMIARGGNNVPLVSNRGAAGSIYRKLPAKSGSLLIDNDNYVTISTNWYTELPPALDAAPTALKDVTLEMRNQARVGILVSMLRIRDLVQVDAGSRLHLLGQTMSVRSPYHAFAAGNEEIVVVEDGGQLIWQTPATVLMVR